MIKRKKRFLDFTEKGKVIGGTVEDYILPKISLKPIVNIEKEGRQIKKRKKK